MARVWTKNQLSAIETRGKTLLVSAGAGSGKTATLTERIIRQILDEDNPININEMLIVTFTKAATAELRERISDAITEKIKENPGNTRLAAQLHMLPSARISTIDAFCQEILRSNCERVGVSPNYRIADEAEATLVADGILNRLFDEIYEGEAVKIATPEELALIAESLTDTKSQGDLAEIIREMHAKTKDLPEGVERIADLIDEYSKNPGMGVEKTRLGTHAVFVAHEFAEHYIRLLSSHRDANAAYGSEKAKCQLRIEVLDADIAIFEAICDAKEYRKIREIMLGAEFMKSPGIPKADAEFLPKTTAVRSAMQKEFKKILGNIFDYSEDEWEIAYSGLYSLLSVFLGIIREYDRRFAAEKVRLSICEFSDVARYTYNCLWQDGEKTDIAIAEAEKYRAIYVDEYQDVNAIQHKIFEAISKPDNRFMVGDIKQSIYGFRGADSTIFAKMKEAFPRLSQGEEGTNASIFMQNNFRCDEGIIDFTNEIFSNLFGAISKSIGYVDDDRLIYSKRHEEEPEYRRPQMCLLPSDASRELESEEGEEYRIEAYVVAEKIRELLDTGRLDSGEAIKPGDIAIIMRNNMGRDKKFAAALESFGIPAAVADTADFFLNAEILLFMSLLNVIDNPGRDIYLAAVLMSPIFGFTADDLAKISREKCDTLYRSLCEYGNKSDDERIAEFRHRLEGWRMYADGIAVDELIAKLYRETGILTLATSEGRECLNRFYEYARKFESSTFRGLYNFINYINNVIDRKHSFDTREANLDPNAVKIITAHSSKGLEFPVVFFVGTASYFKKTKDNRLVYDTRYGISINLKNESGDCLMSNPTRPIISDMIYRHSIEEEARVLYVILTRARERLYLVGLPRKNVDGFMEEALQKRDAYDSYVVYGMKTFAEMVSYSSGAGCVSPEEFIEDMSPELRLALYPPKSDGEETLLAENGENGAPILDFSEIPDEPSALFEELPEKEEVSFSGAGEIAEVISERFGFVYPHEHMTKMPEKISVSRLYPEILDTDSGVLALDEERLKNEESKMERLPVFATGTDETESAKRGIATHLFFQFCDLERLLSLGAEAELIRLVEEKFISREDSARVRINEVETFRRSPLLRDMMGAKSLYRELRFNTRLPASLFTENEELRRKVTSHKILVQGVIDCLYEDADGNLHLVDYKTDRLRYEERQNLALAEARLRAAHSLQLSYYAIAIEEMFGRRPVSTEVYSLHIGRLVDVSM